MPTTETLHREYIGDGFLVVTERTPVQGTYTRYLYETHVFELNPGPTRKSVEPISTRLANRIGVARYSQSYSAHESDITHEITCAKVHRHATSRTYPPLMRRRGKKRGGRSRRAR